MELLDLSEEELCRTLDVDPLTLLSDQLDHRPELLILLDLLARDFAAFENDLATLAERGFVLRGGSAT